MIAHGASCSAREIGQTWRAALPGKRRIKPRKSRHLYLVEWRRAHGYSQRKLARVLRVTDVTISRWETGFSFPNTNVLAAIAEVYNAEPQDLFHHPGVS
jgi:DNA-binding XRE family transcriptional regulator